jgi:CheY-like chemotaxis protein
VVESSLGKGTSFQVRLPASSRTASADVSRSQPETAGRRARVLVIDDEPLMLKAVIRSLASEHDCIGSSSAQEALQRLLAGEQFDVILTDVMMPEMSGGELHARLVQSAPEIARKMVFLTGGAFTAEAKAFLDQVPNRRMEKPFDPASLRAVVREMLR